MDGGIGCRGCAIPREVVVSRSRRVHLLRQDVRYLRIGRRSSRGGDPDGERLEMDCYAGSLTYEGAMSSLAPLLILGETVGVGRGRCMGLGRYVVRG